MGLGTILVIAGVGLVVGLLSGLVGIGGGVLIVPFLYYFYDRPDLFGILVEPEARTVLAHGTSLFVIIPTSLRGALAYHRNRLVEWGAVWPIGIASIAGAVAGAHLAPILPPQALKAGFGILLVYSGIRLGLDRRARAIGGPPRDPRAVLGASIGVGLVVGVLSALLGVGGGVVAIPLLIYFLHMDVRRVAPTTIGIVTITATAGALSYMWSGYGQAGLPRWSVGYVHLSAGLVMFLGAAVSVGWGAALNQRLKPVTLRRLFATIFVLLGARLILTNLGVLTGLD